MGSCANIKGCEGCNLSEYNQTFDFKITNSTTEQKLHCSKDSLEFIEKNQEESKSWWKFEKLLESDKSWKLKNFDE